MARIPLVLGLAGWAAGGAWGAVFTVDPALSSITLSGTSLGAPLQAQGAGSLTAQFEGTLNAEVTEVSITFTGGNVLAARNSGSWQPAPGGAAGNAPANYGGQASVLGSSAVAAVRNAQFQAVSPPLAISAGAFNPASVVFQFLTNSPGALDYRVTGLFLNRSGTEPLEGLATNKVATLATLATSGNVQTLTIPVDSDFFFTLVSDQDTRFTLTGQLVATRTVGDAGPTFGEWVASKFPGITDPAIIGPGADPEGDGVPNLVEFAFGRDPAVSEPALAPLRAGLDPADPAKRVLEFVRPRGLGGVSYVLQVSDTLGSWAPLTAVQQITDLGNGQERVVISDTAPLGGAASRFILLSVGTN